MIPNEYEITSKISFGPETCEIRPKVWFLGSGFCLLRLKEPSGGNWGNPHGPDAVQRFKTLYKNPLEIPDGIPSEGINIQVHVYVYVYNI